jgi:hypothetical protein
MLLSEPVRREFRRYVRLDCQVVREHDFQLVGDLAFDLSTRGMLVRAKTRVLTGEELVVSFKAPYSSRWFDAAATVARVIHGRRPGDYGLCLGIEFHGVDDGDREFLFDQLRGRGCPEPLRPPRCLLQASA